MYGDYGNRHPRPPSLLIKTFPYWLIWSKQDSRWFAVGLTVGLYSNMASQREGYGTYTILEWEGYF